MDSSLKKKNDARKIIKVIFCFLIIFWTIALGLSLWFNIDNTYNNAEEAIRIQARTAFDKDVTVRKWSSRLQGVYVPITDATPPNPYLTSPNRDVTTTTGMELTKINPAYMTRLLHEIDAMESGVRGHITSKKPMRPANKPSEWEAEALTRFEEGTAKEFSEVVTIENEQHMLFMKPLLVEESCLTCHVSQNYEIGEVLGGISASVPIDSAMLRARESINVLLLSHFLVWFLGMALLMLSTRRMLINEKIRERAEDDLYQLNLQLENRVLQGIAEVEKKEAALQNFMDFTEALVYLKDTQRRYVMVNKNYELVSKPYSELEARTDEELGMSMQKGYDKIHDYEEQVFRTQQAVHSTEVFQFADSGRFYLMTMFPVLGDNKKLEAIGGIFFDITSRIQMERDLVKAKEGAESANKAKSDFLANVSHEIRTPLNGVLGMADVLMRTQLTAEQISMVGIIKNGGDCLLSVLNDVLDFSKIEAGKIYLDVISFNLHDVIFDAVRCLASTAYIKNLELIVHITQDVPDALLGDPTRIRQILLNLVSNAIKFTERGEVVITVRAFQEENNKVGLRLSVTDSGIGISPEKQKTIFSAFEQADTSTTRKYGGTGLGLAISLRLVELMGSTLRLDSQIGTGSTFWFDLSLPLSDEVSSLQPEVSVEKFKKVKVLAVDDNKTNLYILTEQLQVWGMEVEQAESVDEAMCLLSIAANKREDFALVLTDYQMPEKDGTELLNEMQANPFLKATPVVMLSSGDLMDNSLIGTLLVAKLAKPVRPVELMRAISSALGLWDCFDLNNIEQDSEEEILQKSSTSLNILLADDIEMNQIVASCMLEDLGHTVVVANDGQEVLDILLAEDFDLLLLDIQMPILGGEETTKMIREKEAEEGLGKHLPIVAMTANALKGDKEKYIAGGMDDYLSKPVRLNELALIIEKIIQFVNPSNENSVPGQIVKEQTVVFSPNAAHSSSYKDENTFDLNVMNDNLGNNARMIVKSIEAYLRDAPTLVKNIDDAIECRDNLKLKTSGIR